MKTMRYMFCVSLLGIAAYLGCSEFVKKTPKKARQEKAQRSSLTEQCAITSDAIISEFFTMQQSSAQANAKIYELLHQVACGESSFIDTIEIEKLKKIVQQEELVLRIEKQLAEASNTLVSLLNE